LPSGHVRHAHRIRFPCAKARSMAIALTPAPTALCVRDAGRRFVTSTA